jgi:hypothetical protein
MGPCKRVKEGGTKGCVTEIHPVSRSPKGRRASSAGNTGAAHLDAHHPTTPLPEPTKSSGTLKSKAKGTGTTSVPAASRRTSPGTSGNVSGPLGVMPNGATVTRAQMGNRLPQAQLRNRTPVYVWGGG